MMNLTPFLLFDGNCAEAMTFYQFCLGGELPITRVGDTPHERPNADRAASQSGSRQPEKRCHRVFCYGLATSHANTETG